MKKIILDGKKLENRIDVHRYLAENLNFPNYYGNNLDALADCLSEISDDTEIEIINGKSLEDNIGQYFKGFIRVFNAVSEGNQKIKFTSDYNG